MQEMERRHRDALRTLQEEIAALKHPPSGPTPAALSTDCEILAETEVGATTGERRPAGSSRVVRESAALAKDDCVVSADTLERSIGKLELTGKPRGKVELVQQQASLTLTAAMEAATDREQRRGDSAEPLLYRPHGSI